jgi:AbrB family looped-hinge helix DNA binding protein
MIRQTVTMDSRGAIVIPAKIRKRLGFGSEGGLWIAEESDGKVILRPAIAVPVESYTPERRAEFLLNNAMDADEYAQAVLKVRAMGLDPAVIAHEPPPGADPRVP